MTPNKVDIRENYILNLDSELLSILLCDKTTKKNIIWATDNYEHRGYGYASSDNITVKTISGYNGKVIKPRIEKSQKELAKRTKEKAEVFTPSWVCNAQNNLIDGAWFGYDGAFNTECTKSWTSTAHKVTFPSGKTWQDYVADTRLEITCGEAPYLVSRYDTVSGQFIELGERIGLLDRKMRIINENISDTEQWYHWAAVAYQSTYGYDWQGDNVLLARENLLLTYIDYHVAWFGIEPTIEVLRGIADIIAWNIWQMDGIKCVVPNSCHKTKPSQQSFFDNIEVEPCPGCQKGDVHRHNGTYCKIKDWSNGKTIKFVSMLKGK